jgi:hypothetical protein
MTTRLSLILLMTALSIITLAGASDPMVVSTISARPYEADELPPKRTETFTPVSHRENFLSGAWTSDKSTQLRVHLALRLVRRPKLNEKQVRIILDAMSVVDDLQALRRRALATLSRDEVADLFANSGTAEQDILKRYYDLSALPLKQRKASFRNASSNDKGDLWRTHLALFLVKRPDLNEWQKTIILAAMALATPENFALQSDSVEWKTKVRARLRALEEQIIAAFSFEDGARIFGTLGDDSGAAKRAPVDAGSVLLNSMNLQLSDPAPYKEWVTIRFTEQDMYRGSGPCECSTDSDWCSLSGYCNGTNCSPTSNGCGTLWSYPCNGASCR